MPQPGDARDDADAPQAWGLRTGQVAALFHVDRRTVIRWADAEVLACGRTEGFAEADVQVLLACRRGQVVEGAGGMLRTGQVARRLGVNPMTMACWSRQGRLAWVCTLGGHRRSWRAEVDRLTWRSATTRPGWRRRPGPGTPCPRRRGGRGAATSNTGQRPRRRSPVEPS